ncbi:hypothetical protein DFH08DRAFT_1080218 [Mycena albidolilacea]|uniref:Uncharacterized protein n=1 Tax=Mycena albidolilacea TaxID=1033008 RepID=A0AAD7A276_9AGAR|nr:hypothetical protein DFH08DRAFT_1080218 [Mycena albidolilacea]
MLHPISPRLLRVVQHDRPDFAHRILLRLLEAAAPHTKLVLANFVLPLASRARRKCSRLANLGKASANAYWMDLTMQVTFNGQERTLREIVALALSAGWKVARVTKAPGSLFGQIVAVPVAVPVSPQRRARAGSGSAPSDVPRLGEVAGAGNAEAGEMEMVERSSRCRRLARALTCRRLRSARFGRGVVVTRRFASSAATPAFETGCGADGPAR